MKKTVLVTRPELQSEGLMQAIDAAGMQPIALPLLAIDAFKDSSSFEQCQRIKSRLSNLAQYQKVIFISTNAVQIGWSWMQRVCGDDLASINKSQQYFAIGKATAKRLTERGVSAERAGLAMNSESLLEHSDLAQLDGEKVLIVRGLGGRNHLKEQLQQRGAKVDYCEVYERRRVSYNQQELPRYLQQGLDFLTMSSAETIQQLLEQAMMDGILTEITAIPAIVPGQRLLDYAQSKGFRAVFQAENASVVAMLEAIEGAKK